MYMGEGGLGVVGRYVKCVEGELKINLFACKSPVRRPLRYVAATKRNCTLVQQSK